MENLIDRYPALQSCAEAIEGAVDLLADVYRVGGTLYICGNGGSAADAEHISGELLKGFLLPRPLSIEDRERLIQLSGEDGAILGNRLQSGLPAVPIGSLISLSTAVANDIGAEFVFAQAAWGLAQKRDALLAISTSGNSENVVYAAVAAKAKGARVIALTGSGGGELRQYSDVSICVPETETYKIQELHVPVYHYICAALERRFFESC